jgi:hypothetical protein
MFFCLLLLVFLFMGLVPAGAQEVTPAMTRMSRVADSTGPVIPNANIAARGEQAGLA